MNEKEKRKALGQLVDAFYNLVEIEERFGVHKRDEVIDGLEGTQPYSLLKLAVHLTALQREGMCEDKERAEIDEMLGDDPTLN